MINSISTTSNRCIQNYTVFRGRNLSEAQNSQTEGQSSQSVILELTKSGYAKNLNMTENIKVTKVPRKYTIEIETLESRINHNNISLEKADRMNLSYGERLDFLKTEGEKWVENIRENDPEMFVQWLKFNKERIMTGHSDLASLSPDFTMRDYYSYVKEPFSALV